MKKTFIISVCVFFTISFFAKGQDDTTGKTKEFFLSINDFSPVSISIAHKRQLKNNTFIKFGLVDLSLKTSSYISKNAIRSTISYSIGIEGGAEFRKPVTENFSFYHGPGISITYGNSFSRIDTLALPAVQNPYYTGSIPYSLGMLIKIRDHFLISGEINPGVTIRYNKFSGTNFNVSTDLNFSNRFAILSFVYRL